ncbi:MAG: TcpE family conjugal transfer membrane protein [Alkaliphilus sp.]
MADRKPIILRTYGSVWKFERQIYSVEKIKLLVPVKPNEVLYFFVSIIIVMLLSKIPLVSNIPAVLRYLIIPFFSTKFFTKQKLDGKLPHKFFIDFLVYSFSAKKIEKFKAIDQARKTRFVTNSSMRYSYFANKTEEILNRKKEAVKGV